MAISVIKNTERWMKAKNKWNYSPALILESEGDYVDNSFPNPNIKVMIKEISRRPNYVAVIKYMLSCSEPQYVSEIQKNTGINPVTLTCILKKLFYHGVINYIDQKTDRNKTYFILNDSILANKIILRFHYLLGFKFAKLVPFDYFCFCFVLDSASFSHRILFPRRCSP